jgi:type I restriction enzyme S subunit
LSAQNTRPFKTNLNKVKYITKKAFDKLTVGGKPEKNDILYTRVGNCGEAASIPYEFDFGVYVSLTLIKPIHELINHKFLVGFLNSNYGKIQANTGAIGIGLKNLNVENVRKYKIPLPPLGEQKAIVKKIEVLFSSLDSGIADLKKAQDQLVIYRQAVLKKAFEGELTKEWREKQTDLPSADELLEQIKEERQSHYKQQLADWKETVKIWEDNGKVEKKPIKPRFIPDLPNLTESEVDLLPNLPNQWKWERANNVMKLITNGSTPKGNKVTTTKNEIPFLKIHNLALNGDFLVNFKLHYISMDTSLNELYRSIILPNDILINTVGPPLGKASLVDSTYSEYNANQNVTIYRTFSSLKPTYIKYFMICSSAITWIKEIATATSGQSYFNLGNCRSIPIPINSLKEQNLIVKEIESRLSVCDKVEESIKESLEKAKALRQSILKKAFEGTLLTEAEIAKCKADKDYEPASVLLERIRKEKK